MPRVNRLGRQLRSLIWRTPVADEVNADLDLHVEMRTHELMGRGLDPVEARAEDGTVEAVSLTRAPGFALGVQWHPEYKVMENSFSRRLFAAFGDAARAYTQARATA